MSDDQNIPNDENPMIEIEGACVDISKAFDEAPIGLAPERCVAIVRALVLAGEKEDLADDEIAGALGMSMAEVWQVRKEIAMLAGTNTESVDSQN